MPFVDVTAEVLEEGKKLEALAQTDAETRAVIEEFDNECELRYMLKQVRKNQNISQEELERITGIPQRTINRIETNFEINTSLKNLIKYVNAIGYELTIQPKQVNYKHEK